jgi:hypothetical protein
VPACAVAVSALPASAMVMMKPTAERAGISEIAEHLATAAQIAECQKQALAPEFDLIRSRVNLSVTGADPAPFMLLSTELPTAAERIEIARWSEIRDTCFQHLMTAMDPTPWGCRNPCGSRWYRSKPPTRTETALFAAAGTKPGQKHAGIDNQKQKPVILYLAARDCRAGEEAQGLNRKSEPIAFMSAKIGDTAPCRGASVDGGVPGCAQSNQAHPTGPRLPRGR